MTDYPIRRSDRARRARISVSADGVEVVVPRRMALRHVTPFVEEKRPWIERTLRRIREAEEAAAVRLAAGGVGAVSRARPHARGARRARAHALTRGAARGHAAGSRRGPGCRARPRRTRE